MPEYYVRFPPPESADENGLIAVGGDLSVKRLLDAYTHGIFPWYIENQPILWWTPDPRYVLYVDNFRVSRSLKKSVRNKGFTVSVNACFDQVIEQCRTIERGTDESGSWITDEMLTAYCDLHRLGLAHSVEAWREDELAGGLYGVSLGRMFFGESMFSTQRDGSKVALHYLVQLLKRWEFPMIDCQLPSEHMISLGAVPVQRERFLSEMADALVEPAPCGAWDSHSTAASNEPL